jgi:hypothetical protein
MTSYLEAVERDAELTAKAREAARHLLESLPDIHRHECANWSDAGKYNIRACTCDLAPLVQWAYAGVPR